MAAGEKDGKEAKNASGSGFDVLKILNMKGSRVKKAAGKQTAGRSPAWRRLAILAGLLVAAVSAVYASALAGGFVFNDASVLASVRAAKQNPDFWSELWKQALDRPLTQQWLLATYVWDVQTAGLSAFYFHLVNVTLHAIATVFWFALVFRLAYRHEGEGRLALDPYFLSFASACIFACHPLAAEAVAYISGRSALLLAVNYFIALNAFTLAFLAKDGSLRFFAYAAAALFTAIGLACDAGALTIPVAMLAVALALKSPRAPWLDWAASRMWPLAATILAAGTLPYLALRGLTTPAGNGSGFAQLPPVSYIATQLKSFVFYYMRSFFFPYGLSIEPYGIVASSFSDPYTLASVAALCAAVYGIWRLRVKPLFAWGLLILLLGLLPWTLVVQSEIVADRRFYLSLAGASLLAAWPLALLYRRSAKQGMVACALIVLVLSGATVVRCLDWSSNESLWRSVLRFNQGSARAHAALALDFVRRGRLEEAAAEAKRAVSIDPGSALSLLSMGATLAAAKDYQGAHAAFKSALECANRQGLSDDLTRSAYLGLAEASLELGMYGQAADLAQAALSSDYSDPAAHLIAGCALRRLGENRVAFIELKAALAANPRLVKAWRPFAEAALAIGVLPVAVQYARALVSREPTAENKILLARVYLSAGAPKQALTLLESLIAAVPQNAEALVLADVACERLGEGKRAESFRKRALAVDARIYSTVELPAPASQGKPASH